MTTIGLKSQKKKYRNASRMLRHVLPTQEWYEQGAIATHYGFVSAYREANSYSLYFIWNGIEYERSGNDSISELALIRRASKLANSVVKDRLAAMV